MKKYELALETEKEFFGIKMFRVRALVSFRYIKSGDLGGYIEKESNLCQKLDTSAWVYGDAQVHGDAQVSGNAQVHGDALVFGNAMVSGNARIHGDALVSGNARIHGDALVSGNARIHGDALVFGNAMVSGNARIHGDALVSENALVSGNALVHGDALVHGYAQVSGNAAIYKRYQVFSIANLRYSFTSLPKGVQIGCKFKSMKEWKENHMQVGTENGFSEELSKAYYELMKSVRKIQKIESKLKT